MNKLLLLFSLSFIFNVSAQVSSNAGPDRLICLMDTLKVTGSGLNPGDTGSYRWTDLNTNSIISTKDNFAVKITTTTTRNYELLVTRISNKVTYTAKDTFQLTVSPLPTFKYKGPSSLCFSEACLNLTYNIIATAMQGNDTSKKFYDIRYFQRFKKPSWVTGGPVGTAPYVYCPQKFITNSKVPNTGLRDTICYEYRDKNGCYNYECKPIKLNPNPDVRLADGIYCQKVGLVDLDKLILIPSNRLAGIEKFRCIQVPAGSGVDPDAILITGNNQHSLDIGLEGENKKTGDYLVEYCFKNPTTSCQTCDTSTITVIKLPKIQFDSIPPLCTNGQLLFLDSFIRDNNNGNRIPADWQCVEYGGTRNTTSTDVKNAINNSVKVQKYFDPKTVLSGGFYLLKATSASSGCPVSDSIGVTVNGLPTILLHAPDSLCSGSGNHKLISNYFYSDTNGKWTGEYVSKGMLNTDLVSMGSSYSKRTKTMFSYRHPLTGCTNTDSQWVTIVKRPVFKFAQSVVKNSKYLVNFDLIDSNMNIQPFKWYWNFGNGATSNDKYPREVLYMDSGQFKVYLTIDNGVCSTTDSITFPLNYKASGISAVDAGRLMVYPNPFNGLLNIVAENEGSISISDVKGQQLLITKVAEGEKKQLNLESLAPGMYILTYEGSGRVYRVKVIRQ